jgi:hypothetical protein
VKKTDFINGASHNNSGVVEMSEAQKNINAIVEGRKALNRRIRKAAALEKKLLKVIKRESAECYRTDVVKDALQSLGVRLGFIPC